MPTGWQTGTMSGRYVTVTLRNVQSTPTKFAHSADR